MRVLVDTSAWVDFFNGHDSQVARTLTQYIKDGEDVLTCGVVLAEFFQGLTDAHTVEGLEQYFREMPCLRPREPDTYLAAAAVYRDLRARGITVRSTIDCLIAELAAEQRAVVLSKDRDLAQILGSGLVSTRAAPLVP